MAPHLKNEHLRGGLSHRRDDQPCLTGGHIYGTKARAAVGKGKSLSTVLGTPMQVTGKPIAVDSWDTLWAVSWESPPPL